MAVKGLPDEGMIGIKVYFAGADDVCTNGAHVAEEVQDIKSIIAEAEAVDILEIEAEDVEWFFFEKLGSPVEV
jgi:hypothetical protein